VIFVDLPSLGIVADALSLAEVATAYILILRESLTRTEREEMVVRRLEAVDANICGFVYNAMSTKSPDYNYKNYGKEYSRQKM
jgi:Mrp family chromosome partitioning ATPase